MRNRNKTVTSTAATYMKWYDRNMNVYYNSSGAVSYTSQSAEIHDMIKPARGFKPCSHTRTTNNFLLMDTGVRKNNNVTYPGYWRYTHMPAASKLYGPSGGTVEVNWASAMTALFNDATNEVPGVNIPVYLAEFKEMVSLFTAVKTGFQLLAQTLKGRGGGLNFSLRDLADGHLAVSFGVLPLLSDLKKLLNFRKKIERALRNAAYRDHRTVRLRALAPVTVSSLSFYKPVKYTSQYGETYTESVAFVSARQCETHAVLSADCYSESRFDDTDVSAFILRALGVFSPLETAWELIPFSFVVDWFVNIGDWVKAHDLKQHIKPITQVVQLSNFGTSLKTTFVDTLTYVSNQGDLGGSISYSGPFPAGSRVIKSYIRTQGIPAAGTAPSGWSLQRTALSISLIAQRVRG